MAEIPPNDIDIRTQHPESGSGTTNVRSTTGLPGVPKFALISHYLPPSRYGQPRVIQRLLQNLPADSYCLVSIEEYDRRVPREEHDAPWLPGRYHRISSGWPWPALLRRYKFHRYAALLNAGPTILSRARDIQEILEIESCEVAIACSGDFVDLPATWLACRRAKRKFVAYVFDDYVEQWGFQPLLRRFAAALERQFIKQANAVVVPNEFLRREYAARYGNSEKVVVINNPYLSDPVDPVSTSMPNTPARMVYTGSIYHVHFDAFKNAAAAVKSLAPEVELHIYSATPSETLRANGIHGFAHHGHVSDASSVAIQRDADILFLPLAFRSKAEAVIKTSAPGKMGEYLASGRPVLVHAPADSFVAWYCREHACAEVVSDPDPALLAASIRRLLRDASYRDALIDAALKRAAADFSPDAARRRFVDLLRGL